MLEVKNALDTCISRYLNLPLAEIQKINIFILRIYQINFLVKYFTVLCILLRKINLKKYIPVNTFYFSVCHAKIYIYALAIQLEYCCAAMLVSSISTLFGELRFS